MRRVAPVLVMIAAFLVVTSGVQSAEAAPSDRCAGTYNRRACELGNSIGDFISAIGRSPGPALSLLDGAQISVCSTYEAARVTNRPLAAVLKQSCKNALTPRIAGKCSQFSAGDARKRWFCTQAFNYVLGL